MTLNVTLFLAIFMGFCVLCGDTPRYTETVTVFSLCVFLAALLDLEGRKK